MNFHCNGAQISVSFIALIRYFPHLSWARQSSKVVVEIDIRGTFLTIILCVNCKKKVDDDSDNCQSLEFIGI